MDIKQLQYLVVSIDNGSFKKASELLYTTQPHISKTIKSLEVELGMQLLKRNARGVEATEEGRKVYEYACRILQAYSYTLRPSSVASTPLAFRLRSCMPSSTSRDLIVLLICGCVVYKSSDAFLKLPLSMLTTRY